MQEYDKNNTYMASVDDLKNLVSLSLDNDTLTFLLNNIVIPGIVYDVFKKTVVWMWNELKGKKINKICADGKTEDKEITFGLDVKCYRNNITMRLSGDFSTEDKNKCIDKAFEYLKEKREKSSINEYPSSTWLRYDNNLKSWYEVDMLSELQRKTNKKYKSK